jgi:hypothetical protein
MARRGLHRKQPSSHPFPELAGTEHAQNQYVA